MARVCTAAAHVSVEAPDARIKPEREAWRTRRWLVIRQALGDPQPAAVIAAHMGLAPHTGRNLLWAYNRRGPAGIATAGRGQRQRAYLNLTQERALVSQFLKKSARGQVSTGLLLKPALERAVGHRVAERTGYRMLKRQHWRTVVPRPRHPGSTPERRAAFKKTSHTRWPNPSRRVPRTIPAPC
jgi:hypothetical protein